MAISRRQWLLGMAGGLVTTVPGAAWSRLLATPPGPEGPFYPAELPLDNDNDLTRVTGRDGVAKGEISDLSGRLLDINGNPIDGGRIEIWQCDANGRYHHPRDSGRALDPNFQGFGHTVTDNAGRYRFRTIKPVPYPGRTPHIHMAVFTPGHRPFVTQLYVRGEPLNQVDFLFRHIPVEARERALASFVPTASGEGYLASFDVVLGITPTSA